jgi:hypothetical protein
MDTTFKMAPGTRNVPVCGMDTVEYEVKESREQTFRFPLERATADDASLGALVLNQTPLVDCHFGILREGVDPFPEFRNSESHIYSKTEIHQGSRLPWGPKRRLN